MFDCLAGVCAGGAVASDLVASWESSLGDGAKTARAVCARSSRAQLRRCIVSGMIGWIAMKELILYIPIQTTPISMLTDNRIMPATARPVE
jgi:hypothetical protein